MKSSARLSFLLFVPALLRFHSSTLLSSEHHHLVVHFDRHSHIQHPTISDHCCAPAAGQSRFTACASTFLTFSQVFPAYRNAQLAFATDGADTEPTTNAPTNTKRQRTQAHYSQFNREVHSPKFHLLPFSQSKTHIPSQTWDRNLPSPSHCRAASLFTTMTPKCLPLLSHRHKRQNKKSHTHRRPRVKRSRSAAARPTASLATSSQTLKAMACPPSR